MPIKTYPGPETIHRHCFPNGLVLLVYENFSAQSIVIDGYLPAGNLHDTRPKAGLADFTTEMLTRGTQNRTLEQIYELLESEGASLDFSADRHTAGFGAGGLAEDIDLILDLLADSLRHPIFPEEEIEQVRGEIMTDLQIRANDTRQMAGLAFRDNLYGDHPYALSVRGYPDSVMAINRDDLLTFHQDYYGPQGLTLALVGAISKSEAIAKVNAHFGDWQNPGQKMSPSVPAASRPDTTRRLFIPMPGKTQADIVLGLPGPGRAHPDYLATSLANTVLGVFGMMGRLGDIVREKQGLAYYVHSQLQGGLGPAPWYVATGVAPQNVEQALDSILSEIRRIQNEPVPQEELEDSKAYRTGSLPVSLETNSGLASIITDLELYGLGLDYLQRFPDLMAEITVEQVQQAAQSHFSAEQLVIAVAGPQT